MRTIVSLMCFSHVQNNAFLRVNLRHSALNYRGVTYTFWSFLRINFFDFGNVSVSPSNVPPCVWPPLPRSRRFVENGRLGNEKTPNIEKSGYFFLIYQLVDSIIYFIANKKREINGIFSFFSLYILQNGARYRIKCCRVDGNVPARRGQAKPVPNVTCSNPNGNRPTTSC